MNRRTLLSPQWLLALLLVCAATTACIYLGLWQYHRFENRSAVAGTIRANYDAAPRALNDVLENVSSSLSADEDYTVVSVTGHYCEKPECDLYVRTRTLNSTVGFWQLVPFMTDEGDVLMVVRGWVPSDQHEAGPGEKPPVTSGQVKLTAHLRPAEPRLAERGLVTGQLQSVNASELKELVPSLGSTYSQVYAVARLEVDTKAQPASLPTALEKPSTSLGPHLSYAFQWWIFSAFFPLGLIVTARRRMLEEASAHKGTKGEDFRPEDAQGAATSPRGQSQPRSSRYGAAAKRTDKPKTRMRRSNEDEEDAFLEERNL